ncbi:hypothetical protein OROGR_012665 [Orobanche gracilis]
MYILQYQKRELDGSPPAIGGELLEAAAESVGEESLRRELQKSAAFESESADGLRDAKKTDNNKHVLGNLPNDIFEYIASKFPIPTMEMYGGDKFERVASSYFPMMVLPVASAGGLLLLLFPCYREFEAPEIDTENGKEGVVSYGFGWIGGGVGCKVVQLSQWRA